MKVEILDIMGSDLTVVNAARVSFAGESEEFGSRDKKLIRQLTVIGHRSHTYSFNLGLKLHCSSLGNYTKALWALRSMRSLGVM